jgi:hypothetical protein
MSSATRHAAFDRDRHREHALKDSDFFALVEAAGDVGAVP